ncbi:MAG TPA: S1 RNA-binding domain-containing protein [Myxococcaceae bacterium]|nr:S1 RNA-binding domain-containing protein [Myxococcaceae bacterium]
MSDDQKGPDKGGFGPRKPRATFGDVMLGIPAGRGGEKQERPRAERRRDDPASAAPTTEPAAEPARREPRKPARRKPPGPLVVVRRASGAIETRGPETPKAEEPAAAAAEASAPGAPSGPEPTAPAPAPAPKSALYEEVPEDQSFAEMLEAQAKTEVGTHRRLPRIGERVTGTIFQLGADTAFLTLGGRTEAMIDLRELKDDEGILRFGVGDTVEAHVVEAGAKGVILSRTLSKGSASLAMLAEARAGGMPVEGLVLAVNKGGFEVAVGDARAFVPLSQMDLRFVDKPDQYIGERLRFRVTEVRERNVVLSRRALLEDEQRALAAETRKSLAEGKVLQGKVTGVRDFGVFVDLGGVEGLVPVSELSHVRVGHPSEVANVGDTVEVEVLRIEPPNPHSPDKAKHKERITLSMRARQEDPWQAFAAGLKEGDRLQGKVVRLQPFGAFVELRPGVDGLIHISAMSERRIAHPRDVLKVGDTVEVAVEKVDPADKRIGLRLVVDGVAVGSGVSTSAPVPEPAAAKEHAPKREAAPRPRAGQVVEGSVDRIEPYGVFLVFPGGRGLVPASETGTERGTDLKRHFQLGQALKAQILEVDGSGKVRLSLTAAERAAERAEMEAWQRTQRPSGGGSKGFGTLGDLLKNRKA